MFGKEKKCTVTFERNFYTQHLQLQVNLSNWNVMLKGRCLDVITTLFDRYI